MLEQTVIAVSGVIAIWLTQDKREAWRRYACIIGMIGQPFWILSTYQAEQWGMLVLSVFYTLAWAKGVWYYWLSGGAEKYLRGKATNP